MLLSFEAATAEELRDKVLSFARVFGLEVDTRQAELPLSAPAAASVATHNDPNMTHSPIRNIMSSPETNEAPVEKRGRGRPPGKKNATTTAEGLKAQAAAAKPADAPAVQEAVPAEHAAPESIPAPVEAPKAEATPAPVTKDQAVAALQALVTAKGMPKAREVLATFSAARLSELPESKLGDFVAACKAAHVAG